MSIRSTFARLSAAGMLVLVGAHISFAQRVEPIGVSPMASTDVAFRQSGQGERPRGPLFTLGGVAGGVVGGTAGFFGGMIAGVMLAHTGNCSGEDCSLGEALLGAAVGETIGVAVGAHVGSARRGNLATALLVSTAIGAVGALAAVNSERKAGPILIATPLLQLVAVLALER